MNVTVKTLETVADRIVLIKANDLLKRHKVVKVTKIDIVESFGTLYEGVIREGRRLFTLHWCVTPDGGILFDHCFCGSNTLCPHYLAVLLKMKYGKVEVDKRVFSPSYFQDIAYGNSTSIGEITDLILSRYQNKGVIDDWYLPFCYDRLVSVAAKAAEAESLALCVDMFVTLISKVDKLLSKYKTQPVSLIDFAEKLNILFFGDVKDRILPAPLREREAAFTYLYRAESKLSGMPTRMTFLRLMSLLCDRGVTIPCMQSLLKKYVVTMPEYADELRVLYYTTLTDMDGDAAASYLVAHIDVPAFRRIALRYNIQNGDYAEAIRLANAGIKHDSKNSSLVAEWYRFKYDVYVATDKKEREKSVAKKLVLLGDIDFYGKYKALFDNADEWEEAGKELFSKLSRKKDGNLYLQLAIEENKQDIILSYCDRHPDKVVGLYPYITPNNYSRLSPIFVKCLHKKAQKKDDSYTRALYKAMQNVLGNETAMRIINTPKD